MQRKIIMDNNDLLSFQGDAIKTYFFIYKRGFTIKYTIQFLNLNNKIKINDFDHRFLIKQTVKVSYHSNYQKNKINNDPIFKM